MEPRAGLNPRPADFSTDAMFLDSRALLLTIGHDFRWYLAGSVQKLFRRIEEFAVMSRNLTRNLEVRNLPNGQAIQG